MYISLQHECRQLWPSRKPIHFSVSPALSQVICVHQVRHHGAGHVPVIRKQYLSSAHRQELIHKHERHRSWIVGVAKRPSFAFIFSVWRRLVRLLQISRGILKLLNRLSLYIRTQVEARHVTSKHFLNSQSLWRGNMPPYLRTE